MVYSNLKQFYSRIYSQSLSSKFLLLGVGCSEGNLSIYDVSGLTNHKDGAVKEKLQSPVCVINAHNDSIYAMASSPEFCITSATGVITGWRWRDLQKGKDKPAWTLNLDCDQANFGTPEINSLAYDAERNLLYVACGDWKTRTFDLETGKQIMALEGHDNYVHCVIISGDQIGSSGEDGKVLLWDARAGREPKVKLFPHTQSRLSRPHIGKFITSLDIEKDWLVCGGGPRAGIFHLRSMALTAPLPSSESSVYVTKFARQGNERGGIIVGGSQSTVYVCSISGDVTSEIPTNSSCIYSVCLAENPHKLMTIGGTGPCLDVCLNLNYRDHSVSIFD